MGSTPTNRTMIEDATSEDYLVVIKCLQQVVDEATDPIFKANRQRRLDKIKARREREMLLECDGRKPGANAREDVVQLHGEALAG